MKILVNGRNGNIDIFLLVVSTFHAFVTKMVLLCVAPYITHT